MRVDHIAVERLELAPKQLQQGRLYVSEKYSVAIHLCCCGCGEKVVTPLSAAEWQVNIRRDRVSLHPSIGNWSMACRSHYWIRDGRVVWAPSMSKAQMQAVFDRDRRDLEALHGVRKAQRAKAERSGWISWLGRLWSKLFG
jgi:Family of unknown function (DUF6527)